MRDIMKIILSTTIFLFTSTSSQVWAQPYQNTCTFDITDNSNKAKVEIAFDGTTISFTLGNFELVVSKKNDASRVDSMEIGIIWSQGISSRLVVPINTPWSVDLPNSVTGQRDTIQAHCKFKF
jgi:hypothetical protein